MKLLLIKVFEEEYLKLCSVKKSYTFKHINYKNMRNFSIFCKLNALVCFQNKLMNTVYFTPGLPRFPGVKYSAGF